MTRSARGLAEENSRLRRRVRELEQETRRLRSAALANAAAAADYVAVSLGDGEYARLPLSELVDGDLMLDESALARSLHVD